MSNPTITHISTEQVFSDHSDTVAVIYAKLVPLTLKLLTAGGKAMKHNALRIQMTSGETKIEKGQGLSFKSSHWMLDNLSGYLTSKRFAKLVSNFPEAIALSTWTADRHLMQPLVSKDFQWYLQSQWRNLTTDRARHVLTEHGTLETTINEYEASMNPNPTSTTPTERIFHMNQVIEQYAAGLDEDGKNFIHVMRNSFMYKHPWQLLQISSSAYYRRREKHIAAITTLLEN